jgi:hypothetical protein
VREPRGFHRAVNPRWPSAREGAGCT